MDANQLVFDEDQLCVIEYPNQYTAIAIYFEKHKRYMRRIQIANLFNLVNEYGSSEDLRIMLNIYEGIKKGE